MGHHTSQQLAGVLAHLQSYSCSTVPELVLHDQDPIQIGHFVAHDHTEYGDSALSSGMQRISEQQSKI